MKKILLLITSCLAFNHALVSQVLYSNSLGNLSLQSFTSGNTVTQCTLVPPQFQLIDDGFLNNNGAPNNPNAPFQVPALGAAGWAVAYNQNVNDTFLVSTSWILADAPVDRWVITNTITNITANTVLTWLAMSPDASFPDGYEVYGTNKTGILTPADFTIGDRLFQLPDGNTAGGGEKSTWTRRSVPLGIFAGQTLRFAFRNNSKNMFQLWIDDIEVKTLSNSLDASMVSLETEKYFLVNTSQTIKVNVLNNGASNISALTLNYKYGTSSVNTQTFGFPNGLAYYQTDTAAFSLPYAISSPGYYPVKAWVSAVNGNSDNNVLNDTAKFFVTVQSSSPQKNVLVEQFVSAYDGESPASEDKLKLFNYAPDRIITVNIHDGDSLKEATSTGVINAYRKNYSTAMIDRVYFNDLLTNTINRPYYEGRVDTRLKTVTPASVSIINKTYNAVTKQLSFTVKADFFGEVQGDYRINAYLTENNVYGNVSDTTVNGYNQLSNYFNVPWSLYYQVGYYSPANNAWVLDVTHFKHANVLIHSFDGSFGSPGFIPSGGGTQGQSYQQTFSLTVPTPTNGINKFNSDNLYIVGFVAEYNANKYGRNVLNAVKEKVNNNSEVVGVKEHSNSMNLNLYPNPCRGILYLSKLPLNENCSVKIYDMIGTLVLAKSVDSINKTAVIDVSGLLPGIYIIEVSSDKSNVKEKLIIE